MVQENKTNEVVSKPLRTIQSHEYMNLYKIIDGKKTNRKDLLRSFDVYTFENYSYNTHINYKSIITRLLKATTFDTPRISIKMIQKFLSGKNHGVVFQSAIKVFLRFAKEKFNKVFVEFDYPKKLKNEEKVIVTLTEEEISKIIEKIPVKYKFLCKFQFICGLRISEPFLIYLEQFNWDKHVKEKDRNGSVIIKKTKSHRERKVPIKSEYMIETFNFVKTRDGDVDKTALLFDFGFEPYVKMKRRQRRRKGFVFLKRYETPDELEKHFMDVVVLKYLRKEIQYYRDAFEIACKAALDGKIYTPHILRKSRATQLLKAGVPILQVSKFLGHKDIKTTQKYLLSDFEDLNESMEKLGL